VSYLHGVSQVLIAPSATITDADSPNMASMTVTLTNPQDSSSGASGIREVLSLNAAATFAANTAGLTVSFTSSVASNTDPVTLSITGSASTAIYRTILDGIQYTDTKSGSHNATARTVTMVVNGGTNNSVSHQVTISVTAPAGVVLSDSDENFIVGTVSDVTLTNVDNTISGAGHLGAGQMILVNEGTIIAAGNFAFEIDTGTSTVINSGTLEATGSGGLVIHNDVINTGVLWANGGNVTIDGNVSGHEKPWRRCCSTTPSLRPPGENGIWRPNEPASARISAQLYERRMASQRRGYL
jgi:hypothetical protein